MNVFLFQPKRSLFWQQSSCWRSSPHSHPQLGSQRGAPCVDHVRISRFPFCIVRAKKKYPNLFRWSSHDDAFPLCLCFNSIASILDFFLLPLIRENKIFSVDREKKIKEYPPNHRFVHEYLQPLSEMMKLIGDRREKNCHKNDASTVSNSCRNVNATGKRLDNGGGKND